MQEMNPSQAGGAPVHPRHTIPSWHELTRSRFLRFLYLLCLLSSSPSQNAKTVTVRQDGRVQNSLRRESICAPKAAIQHSGRTRHVAIKPLELTKKTVFPTTSES
ncbi:unnamed protein product [Calypogeia fissa]